jgi:hypothetical protein
VQTWKSSFLVNVWNQQWFLFLVDPADRGTFRGKLAKKGRGMSGCFTHMKTHDMLFFVEEENAQENEIHHWAQLVGQTSEQLPHIVVGGNGAGNPAQSVIPCLG